MVSPVSGNPTLSNPPSTAACTERPALPSHHSRASTSRLSSVSFPQTSVSSPLRRSGALSAARWNSSSICTERSGVKWHLSVLHFLVKPGFRHPQVAPDGDGGNVQGLGYFIHGEPPEIAELDDLAFSRIKLLEASDTTVKLNEVPSPLLLTLPSLLHRS